MLSPAKSNKLLQTIGILADLGQAVQIREQKTGLKSPVAKQNTLKAGPDTQNGNGNPAAHIKFTTRGEHLQD